MALFPSRVAPSSERHWAAQQQSRDHGSAEVLAFQRSAMFWDPEEMPCFEGQIGDSPHRMGVPCFS